MKIRSWVTMQVYVSVCLTTVFTLLASTAVPVLAAPTLSQELKMTIMNRMPVARERGKVLQSTARAVEEGYPEDLLSPVIEKSLDSGISGDALSRMVEALDEARRKGLPTQPYAEKIMEGLAKKVKEDRILVALDRVGKRMEFAGAQAKKVEGTDGSSRILVIRTGDALAAGMDSKTIERIYDVMAQDRVNRKIEPEDIMEMVKAASGYGVESKSVGDYAISLMKSRKADLDDIRKYLEELSENAYGRDSGTDSDDGNEDEDNGEDDGESDDDGSDDDESDDDESDDD